MKTPIEVKDIRKGDIVRWENDRDTLQRVVEYRALGDGFLWAEHGQHYLLDRPTPPVELPTEPTLGWLTCSQSVGSEPTVPVGVPVYAKWSKPDARKGSSVLKDGETCGIADCWVIAFTPAVAVPKTVLVELEIGLEAWRRGRNNNLAADLMHFIAAVDEANGDRA